MFLSDGAKNQKASPFGSFSGCMSAFCLSRITFLEDGVTGKNANYDSESMCLCDLVNIYAHKSIYLYICVCACVHAFNDQSIQRHETHLTILYFT